MRIDLMQVIDWTSIKLTGMSVGFAAITGSGFLTILAAIATGSTIVYNGIRIYKEIKSKSK